ncbi:MICOS complex subunit Mic10-like [Diprion similis]|uniref:MICOS complex subunit Mic10-like n=1 Tax=Diprion similis TaxID=362088 RepID=UPI001EF974AA|nr:MICOS complex subunit Mic10-like [Diprion similis]XP_046735908.1 MICOS complex subunit Mic10-like [Diprion similis]XP_046735910.1 MICOS complex subunit Mic10-like [Diprion similis]
MAGTWAEDEIGRKWDRCFTDAVLKLGGGVFLGSVFSLLFFRRKKWPIITGGGFGLGMAYSNCEKDINATVTQNRPQGRKCEEKKK